MPMEVTNVKKLTNRGFLNLFEAQWKNGNTTGAWIYASRKKNPRKEKDNSDAVVIVPILETPKGNCLVLIREYRVPIEKYEIGFPAGLLEINENIIDAAKRELKEETGFEVTEIVDTSCKLISSGGMSDETIHMVIVKCRMPENCETNHGDAEDIQIMIAGLPEIRTMLDDPDICLSAKVWPFLMMYDKMGSIG